MFFSHSIFQSFMQSSVLYIQKREWIDSPTAELTGNRLPSDSLQFLFSDDRTCEIKF